MTLVAVYGEELDPEVLEERVGSLEDSEFLGNTLVVNSVLEQVEIAGVRTSNVAKARGYVHVAVWDMGVASARQYEESRNVFDKQSMRVPLPDIHVFNAFSNIRVFAPWPGSKPELSMYVANPAQKRVVEPTNEESWAVIRGIQMVVDLGIPHVAEALPEHLANYVNRVFGRAALLPRMMIRPTSWVNGRNVDLSPDNLDYLNITPGDPVEVQYNGISTVGVAQKMSLTKATVWSDRTPLDQLVMADVGVLRELGIELKTGRPPREQYHDVLVRSLQ